LSTGSYLPLIGTYAISGRYEQVRFDHQACKNFSLPSPLLFSRDTGKNTAQKRFSQKRSLLLQKLLGLFAQNLRAEPKVPRLVCLASSERRRGRRIWHTLCNLEIIKLPGNVHPIFTWFWVVHERVHWCFHQESSSIPANWCSETTQRTKAEHFAILFTLTLCLNSKSPSSTTTHSAYEA